MRTTTRNIITVTYLLAICRMGLAAGDQPDRRSFYPQASIRYLKPNTTLGSLPGITSCCDSLGNGTGLGLSLLLGKTFPLSSKEFVFDVLLGGAMTNLSFARRDFIGWGLVNRNNQDIIDSSIVEHTLQLRSYGVEGRAQLAYRPLSLDGLSFHAGISGMMTLTAQANQVETLLQPVDAIFDDSQSRTRLKYDGTVTSSLKPWITAYTGAAYEFPLSKSLRMYLGLSGEVPLTQYAVAGQRTLSMGLLRLDVGVTFPWVPEEPVVTPQPPPEPPKRWLNSALRVQELRPDGTLNNVGLVKIEETLSKQVYPLLPYIFFAEAESVLDANKYVNLVPRQTTSFNETRDFTFDRSRASSRSAITLELYYNILNIIGRRMRDEMPKVTLALNGYNNGRDREKGDTILSRRRADNVKDYLVRVWGIDARRITTTAGNLAPRAASTSMADLRDREDGFEENRRVEIIPSDATLLDPVVIRDTLREINVPALRYSMDVQGNVEVQDWSLVANHPFIPIDDVKGKMIQRDGAGSPPAYIDWSPGDSQREIPKSSDPVLAAFVVNGAEGLTDTSANRLPVEFISIAKKKTERVGNLSVDRCRLPLFAYGKDKMLTAQADILERYLKPDLDAKSTLKIQAFSDRKGAASLNQSISQQRANQIREILKEYKVTAVEGVGEGTATQAVPFTNDTPEARLYNRTVEITVYKKVE